MSEKRRLYTDVYGLISTDAKGFQVVSALTRGSLVDVDPKQRTVLDPYGRTYRLDKARFQQVLRASVPLES